MDLGFVQKRPYVLHPWYISLLEGRGVVLDSSLTVEKRSPVSVSNLLPPTAPHFLHSETPDIRCCCQARHYLNPLKAGFSATRSPLVFLQHLLPNSNESRPMQSGGWREYRQKGWGGGGRDSTPFPYTAISTGCLFQNESCAKLQMLRLHLLSSPPYPSLSSKHTQTYLPGLINRSCIVLLELSALS